MNEAALVKQYEREKGIHKNIKKIADTDSSSKPINFSSLVITPKMIIVSVVVLLVASSFLYLYAQVNNFVSAPRLAIIQPTNGASTNSTSTHVTGVAEKDALVFINDQNVLVNENGQFAEDVGLKPGLNIITVRARSRFNKEATASVSVSANFQAAPAQASDSNLSQSPDSAQPADSQAVSNPQEPVNGQQSNGGGSFSAEVSVGPNPTWLSVEVDGEVKYSGVLDPSSPQTFNPNKTLSITSSKGDGTFVKINGKDMGMLSPNPTIVKDVEYDENGKVEQKNN